jgi:segregation and condensation protein B
MSSDEQEDRRDGEDGGLGILAALEAMLFVSPEPLKLEEIEQALEDVPCEEIERGLDAFARALQAPGRGLKLERVAGGYRLVTRPELAAPLRALFRYRNRKRLTPAQLDVLAIVAYAQPITAPEIQEIRGTDPAYALKALQERRLLRIVGRKRVVGRPILYGTTREFLLHFGLDSLEDLPPVEGYGTQVVPSQGRLFPVTSDAGEELYDPEVERTDEDGEPAPEATESDERDRDQAGESLESRSSGSGEPPATAAEDDEPDEEEREQRPSGGGGPDTTSLAARHAGDDVVG